MKNGVSVPTCRERGFSLIEMLIVVAIIMITAAVALPNIGQYIRNYKIRGGMQLVAGEMQAARSKAIMMNTNSGVTFAIVDRDSFRYIMEDLPAAEQLGPLRDLPNGVTFVLSTLASPGPTVRFNRLGGFCNPVAGGSCLAAPATLCTAQEQAGPKRCDPATAGNYLGADAGGNMVITLRDAGSALQRTVRLAPGGRILPQP